MEYSLFCVSSSLICVYIYVTFFLPGVPSEVRKQHLQLPESLLNCCTLAPPPLPSPFACHLHWNTADKVQEVFGSLRILLLEAYRSVVKHYLLNLYKKARFHPSILQSRYDSKLLKHLMKKNFSFSLSDFFFFLCKWIVVLQS